MNELLVPYQERFKISLTEKIESWGPKTKLREACFYALLNGGKHLRPAIVMMVADALGKGKDVSNAAIAVECFHAASLVVDDLPCMDNDEMRRGKPSVHKKFGEALALLTSYALIAHGYEGIAKNSVDDEITCRMALENATFNTGLKGATGGQFLDVFPSQLNLSVLREVIHKKTVSLFEIAFVFGWLFGGGDVNKIQEVKNAASHFGMMFQIADDLDDAAQDKTNQSKMNTANLLGTDKALELFHEEQKLYQKAILSLNISNPLEKVIPHL